MALCIFVQPSQSGPSASLSKELEVSTQAEIAEMQAMYAANKQKVIELLLAAATTVTIDVADNLKLESSQ